MNKPNRRQFLKESTAVGLVGLIAPSFVLSSGTNTKNEVLLTVATVKVSLRLAYWDKSKTWHPLEIVQKGAVLKSKGPVKVTCKLKQKWSSIRYELEVKSPFSTRIAMFLSLPGTSADTPVFHVLPGLLFGDNNLANVLDKNAFHHLTDEPLEGKAFSPVWEFRADRCAMPLSAMCSEKATIAISIDPYTESKSDEPTTIVNGVSSMLADDVTPASCGVTLGYANLPFTYPYQGSFTAPVEDTLFSEKASGRIYAEATGDRRSVNRFVREEYQHRRALPKIKKTLNEALVACATAMRDVLWSPEDKAFCNLYFDKGVTHARDARKRILEEIGWCGGPSIALPAIQAGLYLNDKDLIQHGLDTCNVVPTLLNHKSGLLYDNGMTGKKDVNGWWSGRAGRDKHFAYTNGSCVSDLMCVAKVLEDAGMEVPDAWYEITTTVLDTIASLQLEDGNLGFAYSIDRPEIIDPHGAIGAWWIPGFALASKRLNKPHYMKVARRALEYYHQAYINLDVNGASMDTGKSPNEESSNAFIRAARILHELTRDDYYLEALRDGIDLECLWRYGYATKPLFPPLSNSGWNSCGGSVTSVANPCIHPMGIRVSDDLRYYARVTGDQYVYKRWEDGINWSVASLELYPKYTGIGPFGITSERYCQSDGMLYPKFDDEGELWSIWSSCHCFGVAAMLEGLVDAVDNDIVRTQGNNTISICCSEDNDLYQLLKTREQSCNRYDDIAAALEASPGNETLLILAKDYPNKKTVLPEGFYKKVKEKNLKVYVEFPDRLESGKTGEIKSTERERLVITSTLLGKKHLLDVLDAGLFSYVEVADRESHLKGAKVAGFNKAVYGLENTPNFPILFEEDDVLVSTTKLSDFKKSRYSPYGTCRNIIGGILSHLSIGMEEETIQWESIVKPTFGANDQLPANAHRKAIDRGAQWYTKARFLIHPDWKEHWRAIDVKNPPVGPPMDLDLPSGDGSLGVMEGHYSFINPDGSQQYRYWLRADCVAETAMTLAIANGVKDDPQHLATANNLMDFLFNTETFKTASSMDPTKSSYGLVGWADTQVNRYYGDDNARIILGSVLVSQTMGNPKWDKQIVELILSNFRTSGKKGFRGSALVGETIDQTTWQVLMERDIENIAPHYESWLWATYLWLYDKTGYKPLLEKAKKAIKITMDNYPANWKWTNGLQQERARMILPLAWLVRAEDTHQHRDWLNLICDDLLKYQVDCGVFREELGISANGQYGAPKTNAAYGTSEAPLIQFNGEPVADMLYTSNFAFFALNEAAQATQEPKYLAAVDKLADFLVRIQSTSSGREDLDGCWFRAFDYESWEYYGSNADYGWGAWGTLTGWLQSFITTTLAMKLENTSYWEKTKESTVGAEIEEIWQQMLPGVEH